MALPDFRFTPPISLITPEYPPGFDPAAILGYLNTTIDCFWFDDVLRYLREGRDFGWDPLMQKIWRNVIPEDIYNRSLIHCYDAVLGSNPDNYLYGAL